MKIKDLTHKQLTIISNSDPSWIAINIPQWMIDNHPLWMAEHEPNLMAKLNPKWMLKYRPELMRDKRYVPTIKKYHGWDDVPDDILKLLK